MFDRLALVASRPGITPEQARDPAIHAEIRKNMTLAGQLGATRTSLFVTGNKVMNSAVDYEVLKEAVASARARA